MYRRRCKHCGADTGSIDFSTCGHCAMLATGVWVDTPEGPGEVVSVRHSGGFIVAVHGIGNRQYSGSDLTVQVDPAPAREPGSDDLEPEPTTAAAPIAVPQPAQELEPPIRADRTSDCPPLSCCDPDPLARIRRALLARPFPAWALVPQPR